MNCPDKKTYATKAIAIQTRAASRRYGVELYVYKCPHCGFWHLSKWKWESAS